MNDIYELKKRRDQYYSLRDNLQIIIRHLNSSIEALDTSIQKMNDCYTIDGVTFDNDKIKTYRNNLEEERNNILHTVIPNIDKEINSLKWKIQQLELTSF